MPDHEAPSDHVEERNEPMAESALAPEPQHEVGPSTTSTTNIDELFGTAGADEGQYDDVFAQIGTSQEDTGDDFHKLVQDNEEAPGSTETPAEAADPPVPPSEPSHQTDLLGPTQQEEKFFADVTQATQPVPTSAPEHVEPQPSEQPIHVEPSTDADRDFSDLLAEFEAENDVTPEEPLGALEDTPVANAELEVLAVEEQEVPQDQTPGHDNVAQTEQQSGNVPESDALVGGDNFTSGAEASALEQPVAASAFFADDPTDSSGFDDIIATAPREDGNDESQAPTSSTPPRPTSPSPVPSLSIEHTQADIRPTGLGIDAGDTSIQSMFSDASNWLADTTFDDSVQILPDNDHNEAAPNSERGAGVQAGQTGKGGDGSEPLHFEVPQGWYDDQGEWHWYTDEEREQVKLTMLGHNSWEEETDQAPDQQGLGQDQTPLMPYSPALNVQSENAARRTPQPETPSRMPDTSYDPYAPSTAYPSITTAGSSYSGPSTSAYTPSTSSYAPYSASTSSQSYTAPASTYDSYAPTATNPAQPVSNPYAPAAQQQQRNPYIPDTQTSTNPYAASTQSPADPYAPASLPTNLYAPVGPYTAASPIKAKDTKAAPPKPAPQRVASNAYDPPFLRPQKSFVRPPSAVPTISPAFAAPPTMTMSHPQASATPPPPPSGPPRKTKAEARPPSRGPAYAAPPAPAIGRAQTTADMQYGYGGEYDALPRPPSASQNRQSIDAAAQSVSPPQPLQRPPPSAYDPPMPQRSFAAPPRSSSVASQRGYGTSPKPQASSAFAPPPKAVQSPYAPPPPLSRGPASRTASPIFEARPPSRHDVTQRMRSPPQSARSAGVEHLLSPPTVNSHMPEAQGRTSFDAHRSPRRYEGELRDEQQYQHHEQEPPHMSPPVLSRKYDEDGDDGFEGEAEDPYAPSQVRNPQASPGQRHEQQAQDAPFQLSGNHPSAPPPRAYTASPASHQPTQDPYAPASSSLGLKTHASPERKSNIASSPYALYAPQESSGAIDLNDDPYAPSSHFQPAHPTRGSTTTSSYEPSPYSPATSSKPLGIPSSSGPYNPAPARTASPAYSTGYGMSPPTNNFFQSMHTEQPSDATYVPQQVLEQKPVSEDPLGRCTLAARNAPIAVFGFGGTLITAFPGAAESGNFHKGHSRVPSYGYASGRGQLWIRSVSEVAAPAALKSDQTAFPGPLVSDPAATKGAAGDKKKRESVLAYLDARAEEIERGLPYLKSSANKARREEEGRLVLIKVLKALVIGEGKLAGNPQVEEALRDALANPSVQTISTAPIGSLAVNSFSSSLYPPTSSSSTSKPVSATPSQLTHISNLLSQGNKKDAAIYAAEQGLWSHALVISSSVDVELWRDLVGRFTAAELGDKPQGTAGIKASYLLFGGVNSANVDDLVNAATITDDPSNDQWREVIGAVLFNAKPTELSCLEELGSKFLKIGLNNAAHTCFLLSPLSPFFDLTPGAYERQIMLTHNFRDEESIVFAEIAEYARGLVPAAKGPELPVVGLPQLLPYKLARAWRLAELGEVDLAKKYCAAIEAGSKLGKNMPSLLAPAFAASLEDLLERLTGTPSVNPANTLGSGRKSGGKPGFDKLGSWIEGRLTKFIAGEEGDNAPPTSSSATAGKAAGPFAHFSTISPNASGTLTRQASTADFNGAAPNGYLGVQSVSRTTSPALQMTPQWGQAPQLPNQAYGQASHASSSSSSSYGDQYAQHTGVSGYSSWTDNNGPNEGEETPHVHGQDQAATAGAGHDDRDFISPMAQLSLGPSEPSASARPAQNYVPSRQQTYDDDDEDDLGFGNAALSRNRTPKPAGQEGDSGSQAAADDASKKAFAKEAKSEPTKAEPAPPAKRELPTEHKSSWLGRIWGGKKEGETSGPVKANLGEESSMVFDPELKRWVVKGAKAEAAPAAATPPPPRAATASPSRSVRTEPPSAARANSATPPQGHRPPPPGMSSINGNSGVANTFPRSSGAGPPSMGFAEGPDGGIKRVKSTLNESVTASDITSSATPPLPGAGGPPRLPSGPPNRASTAGGTGASLDDLLSRPPSKRPGSAAAKKGARNRYVDVFQPGAEGQ
ncbi:hypothetical protein I316_01317 [Kwoniella heveanensis BCC8398]|uniref:Protein transport protein sec16 n=1 Tax=Kwoniella heveanensis BCC8398 TaxID=1296120 RepID=A0A1B9H0C0_9TREE|nr:hypothetical protein I316_01317 [Kwoniella heveanensis BCC8398]